MTEIHPSPASSGNLNRIATICGVGASAVGALGLLGWVSGLRLLGSISPAYLPMSPDTAVILILFGSSLVLQVRSQPRNPARRYVTVLVAVAAVYGALKYLEYFVQADLTFERVLFPITETLGSFPIGRMSPLSGLVFLLSGLALVLVLWKQDHSLAQNLAGLFGIFVFGTGFVATTGYAYGSPLLYNSNAIPPAPTTAVGFVILGFGLVAGSGRSSLFIRPFAGPSVRARMLRAFLPLTEVIVFLFGLFDVRAEKTSIINPAVSLAALSLIFLTATAAAVTLVARFISRAIERVEEEQRRAEAELAKFRLGIDRSGDAVFMTDREGTIIYVNPAFEKIYGYAKDEVLGKTPRVLKSGTLSPEVFVHFWDTLLAQQTVAGEIVNKTKDGRLITVDGSSNPIVDAAGEIIGFLAIQRDISAEKEATAERERLLAQVQEAERRYRSLFENMLDGYAHCQMLFDAARRPVDFITLDVNQSFGPLTGLKDVVGKRATEVIPGIQETNPELFETYGRVTLTGEPEELETYLPGLGIWVSISVYRPQAGEFVTLMENITDRKAAEEALTRERNLLRTIIDNLPDQVFAKDTQGRFILNNQAVAHQLGTVPEEMLGKTDYDYFSAEVAAQHQREDQAVIQTGKAITIETAALGPAHSLT